MPFVLCTRNFACTNMPAEPFYVHKNQCMQVLNLPSPDQAYSGIIQAFSGPCVNPYIQNPSILRTEGIFRTLVYSKP